MSTTRDNNPIEAVYTAQTPDELARAYQAWANAYDRETLELGYCSPFAITAWLARHVTDRDGEILDAGCGTGLSAPIMNALGYTRLCGLDFSNNMLNLARARGGYRELVQAELGKTLPFDDGRFTAFISSGVFTAGHAPANSFRELVRILRLGGFAIFTVRDSIFESGGFRAVFAGLESSSAWRLIERSPPFRAFVIGEPEVIVTTFVFQKT
jgi:predicted TPR repeat methyltransferase